MIGINQFLAYNSKNDSLYMVTDGKIVSVPVAKLLNHSVQTSDLRAIDFASGKEFENLSFDQAGYGYLMTIRTPEILKSDRPL